MTTTTFGEALAASDASQGQGALTDGFHLLVDALKLNGVETIYGLVGIPVTDLARLAQASGIRYIGFRHEQSAGNAAAAGFLTKKPGVCLTVSAPGFLNGLVALANATTNCFPMVQNAVLNLCRVKLRDQQRLERVGYLEEYPQYPNGTFTDVVPRGGNAGGGGQPGWVLKCKGWEDDPNAYIYFTIQEQNWARTAEAVGHPEWKDDPAYTTAEARQPHIFDIFADIEKWLADKTKYEAVDILRTYEIPCAPVMSMKEIAYDPDLRQSRTVVEVEQKERGTYLTVGSPIKFSSFEPDIKGAPLLGEHSDEVLADLGYDAGQIAQLHAKKVVA
jgi:hypothetical protein